MQKLLIADASEDFRMALAEQLRGAYVVRVCGDGKQALQMLRSMKPDVLVVDLMLPELDGISLLQRTVQEGLRPMVLATTRFANDYVVNAAVRLGVGYVIMKPCDVRATVARIRDLTQPEETVLPDEKDPQRLVTNMLLALNVPTKRRGFICLREAVLAAMEDPNQLMTKELYPKVAKRCDGNVKQVERAIRSAIVAAWEIRDEETWRLYFQPGKDGRLARPTNQEMISCLASHAAMKGKS